MDDMIKEYLDYVLIEKKLSVNTYKSYKNDLDKYVAFWMVRNLAILRGRMLLDLLKKWGMIICLVRQ